MFCRVLGLAGSDGGMINKTGRRELGYAASRVSGKRTGLPVS